jgi:hypothetical protein
MRRVQFWWRERLAVAPIEGVIHFQRMLLSGLLLALFSGISSRGVSVSWGLGGRALLLWLLSYGLSCLLGPLLLPGLPSRAFSVKGVWLGLLLGAGGLWGADWNVLRMVAWMLLVMAGASHLLLNFTGSTPFTSPSGVRREVRLALPIQGAVGAIGLAAWIAAGFVSPG